LIAQGDVSSRNLLHFLLHNLVRPRWYISGSEVFSPIPMGREARTLLNLRTRPDQQSAVDDQQQDNRKAHEISAQPDKGACAVFHRILL